MDIKFPWAVGPFTVKKKLALPMIENFLREKGFAMDVAINYDPHCIISNRRQTNRNKTFEHAEVAGLVEKEFWMEYPREASYDEDMPENLTSSTLVGDSPQQDLSNIVVVATHITPLASMSGKGNKREWWEAMDVDQRDITKTPKK